MSNVLEKILPSEEDINSCKHEEDKEYNEYLRAEGLRISSGKVEIQSLYESLHRVGDDPLKGAIQRSLTALLDEETYKLVEKVFHYHTQLDVW